MDVSVIYCQNNAVWHLKTLWHTAISFYLHTWGSRLGSSANVCWVCLPIWGLLAYLDWPRLEWNRPFCFLRPLCSSGLALACARDNGRGTREHASSQISRLCLHSAQSKSHCWAQIQGLGKQASLWSHIKCMDTKRGEGLGVSLQFTTRTSIRPNKIDVFTSQLESMALVENEWTLSPLENCPQTGLWELLEVTKCHIILSDQVSHFLWYSTPLPLVHPHSGTRVPGCPEDAQKVAALPRSTPQPLGPESQILLSLK